MRHARWCRIRNDDTCQCQVTDRAREADEARADEAAVRECWEGDR